MAVTYARLRWVLHRVWNAPDRFSYRDEAIGDAALRGGHPAKSRVKRRSKGDAALEALG
jgi:hypothetical protein